MIKVLIVEDDPMVREINSKFLSKVDGFELVEVSPNIQGAREVLKESNIDLVLLDVFLPDGNGIELLKWMRSEKIEADTILITAENSKRAVEEAFKYGLFDYLVKPFKFNRFKEALENYKGMKRTFDEVECFDQSSIDEHVLYLKKSIQKSDEDSNYIKGVSAKTYSKIIEYLKEITGEKKTAEEIADAIGLSRVTVRRYLEKMSEEGKVNIIQEYGKIGRPTNFYSLKL